MSREFKNNCNVYVIYVQYLIWIDSFIAAFKFKLKAYRQNTSSRMPHHICGSTTSNSIPSSLKNPSKLFDKNNPLVDESDSFFFSKLKKTIHRYIVVAYVIHTLLLMRAACTIFVYRCRGSLNSLRKKVPLPTEIHYFGLDCNPKCCEMYNPRRHSLK